MSSHDNYPPGAALDPRAPYNEPVEAPVELFIKETVTRKAEVPMPLPHTSDMLLPDVLCEAYETEFRNVQQTMAACRRVLSALIKARTLYVADTYLPRLLADCDDWVTEETDVQLF